MYAVKEAVTCMIRSRFMVVIAVLTISVALLLLGIVGISTVAANGVINKIQKSEEVSVYLNDDMSDGDMLALDETIRMLNEVESTRIVSKEDAVREFEQMFGNDLLGSIDENPLPRSIVVTMSRGYRSSEDLDKFAERIRPVTGVESIEYGREWISKLDIFLLIFIIVEIILAALVITACILIISNTITLTLLARKEAIEIMRLVGATDSFIRKPFYFEGLLEGLLSGGVVFIVFYSVYIWLQYAVPDFDVYMYMFGIRDIKYLTFPWAFGIIIPVGGFLGFLGSYVAVRRAF